MSEHDDPAQDDGAPHGWTRAPRQRLSAAACCRPGDGRGGGWPSLWPASCRLPCWSCWRRWCVSWEWGRLVHGTEAGIVVAVQIGTAALAAVLAAFGFVGLGLLALPIGAILAMLLSLGRNSLFSALGVFYAGLPAVALIWLRVRCVAGPAGGGLPDRHRRHRRHRGLPGRPAAGRAEAVAARFAQQDLGGPDRRAGRERHRRRAVLVRGAGRFRRAAGGYRGRAGSRGAGGRSCRDRR